MTKPFWNIHSTLTDYSSSIPHPSEAHRRRGSIGDALQLRRGDWFSPTRKTNRVVEAPASSGDLLNLIVRFDARQFVFEIAYGPTLANPHNFRNTLPRRE